MHDFYDVAEKHYRQAGAELIRDEIAETNRMSMAAAGIEFVHYQRLLGIQRRALRRARVRRLLLHQ